MTQLNGFLSEDRPLHRNLSFSSFFFQLIFISFIIFQNRPKMSGYSEFKREHPTHQLMRDKIQEHAEAQSTIDAIANGTYVRPKPKVIYGPYADDFARFFGDKWAKKAQNAVSVIFKEFNLPSEKELRGGKGKLFKMCVFN